MIIMGIDPGSVNCGFGVILTEGNKSSLIEYGVIKAKVFDENLSKRIYYIFDRIDEKIKNHKPNFFCLETVFNAKNIQSLIKLSHARAAAMLAAEKNTIELAEYSPNEIKKSVTGRGHSSKEQVQFMVKKILNITETPDLFDATDALAAALCHSFKLNSTVSKASNWKNFIKENPSMVKG